MFDFEPLLAAINDDMSLNNKPVVNLLVDVLLETGRTARSSDLLSSFRTIEQNSAGPKAETADEILRRLQDMDIIEYSSYMNEISEQGIQFTHLFHEDYPERLWNLEDQPIALYKDGGHMLDEQNIAIVGTRGAADSRKNDTQLIASSLAENGYTVVSGLALGIDSAAHIGAIKGGGDTLAILPSDIQTVQPKSNSDLASRIRENGALVSEVSKFAPMHNGRYVERNRIISGISEAVIVTASSTTGGTIRQAEIARKQGVPRFMYDPDDGTDQSPKVLRELGFIPFSDVEELFELLSSKNELFHSRGTKARTLDEF